MGKLVRDRIPEIIEQDGKTPVIRMMDEHEYKEELRKKLLEEVQEYLTDESVEEMADMLEVMHALCAVTGHTMAEVEQARVRKCRERGGFEKRIFWEGNRE
ncbi:MAG: phosphoribosyl-ATP pyrophosphohydrolase [Bulleidia sp.]